MNKPIDQESFKEFIRKHQRDFLLDNLPLAVETYNKLLTQKKCNKCKGSGEIEGKPCSWCGGTGEDRSLMNLRYNAAKDVAKAGGVLPAESQSIYIQQINQSTSLTLSPMVSQIIQAHLREVTGAVVEAEVIEGGGGSGKEVGVEGKELLSNQHTEEE